MSEVNGVGNLLTDESVANTKYEFYGFIAMKLVNVVVRTSKT